MPMKIICTGLVFDASFTYLEQIKETMKHQPDKNLILMVPDRFSYLAEKKICESIGGLGFGNLKVLTLSQLIRKLSTSCDALSSVGKQMLLRRIIDDSIDEKSVFYSTKDRMGFIQSVLDVINDFKRFLVDIPKFKNEIIPIKDTLTGKKLTDLIKIYDSYNAEFKDKGFKDEADLLYEAAALISSKGLFKDSEIWIDGFVEFAPTEMSVLKSFLESGADVNVFLPARSAETDTDDVYSIPMSTKSNLVKMCKKHGFPYTVSFCDTPKKISKPIKFLCDTYDDRDQVCNDFAPEIELHKADEVYTEVEAAAMKILDLVIDGGYKFSDISVLCGNPGSYISCIEAVFEKYSIPYFADYKVPLQSHPVSILLLCVFDILDKKRFLESHVIRYLKTGYVLDNSDDIDYLSLFIKKRGISGNMWNDEKYFTMESQGFFDEAMGINTRLIPNHKKLQKLRGLVLDPLLDYYEKSKGRKTLKEHVAYLFEFFESIRLYKKIHSYVEEFEKSGEENEALRLTQVWNILVELFDQMVLAFGDIKVSRNVFGEYLRAGIEASEISIIPSMTNGVTVSDAGHRKGTEVGALFVLGATADSVPAVIKNDSLISEDEIELFTSLPSSVGKTVRNRSKEFELLSAFSETSKYLYISNSTTGIDGDKTEDSYIFDFIKNKFPKTEIGFRDDELSITIPDAMLHKLLLKIASGEELSPYYEAIKQWFSHHPQMKEALGLIDEAEKYKVLEGSISKEISKELYANLTQYSVSRLEKYFQCPFMYYLSFGLKLEDDEAYGIKSTDTGSIIHHAIALYCQMVEGESKTADEKKEKWTSLTTEKSHEIISSIVTELSDSVQLSKEDTKIAEVFSRLESTIKKAADIIHLMLIKGNYSIFANEMRFEDFRLSDGTNDIDFHGIIDRIDIREEDGKIFIRIVDYKTGEKKFDLVDALNGVDLQLIIYAMAAREKFSNADIGGLFYNSIKKRVLSLKDTQKLSEELKKAYKLSGTIVEAEEDNIIEVKTGIDMDSDLDYLGESSFLNLKLNKDRSYSKASEVITSQKMDAVLTSIKEITTKAAKDIKDGDVRVYPYKTSKKDSCKFCPYASVCMYDLCKGAKENTGAKGAEIMKSINNNEIG